MTLLRYTIILTLLFVVRYSRGQQADVVTSRYKATQTEAVRVKGIKTDANFSALAQVNKTSAISYTDGLGRTIATIAIQASPNQKDIYTIPAYDQFGRVDTTYLPFVNAYSDGRWMHRWDAITALKTFYNNAADKIEDDTHPFAASVFEASPIGLVKEKGAPGMAWQPGNGHTTREVQRVNVTNEIRLWKADGTSPGYYAPGTIQVFEITDQNGNKVLNFIDKLGHTIQRRVQADATTWLTTIYIYSEVGRLRYIIQPEGVKLLGAGTTITSSILANYCFSYIYDQRGRLIEKVVPGTAPIYFGYDPLDRLALIQDGNCRPANKWYFIKYDAKGRPVLQGMYTNTTHTTRSAIQANVLDGLYSGTSPHYEGKLAGAAHGYSNVSFPTVNAEILMVNYYDDYDFDGNGTNDYAYVAQGFAEEGQPGSSRGKVTGTKSLVMGSSVWLVNYVFYDIKGRAIQVRANNHLSPVPDNLLSFEYNFDGTVKTSKSFHNVQGVNQTTVVNKYEYDHIGRLQRVYQNNNNTADQLVVQYEYNEIGQLVDKKLHNTAGTNFLQSVDFRYTIHGNLLSINNAQLTTDARNDDSNDYFGMELLYEKKETGLNDKSGDLVYWNGNIGALKWKSVGYAAGLTDQRSYKFKYDKSDRLLASTFQSYGTDWSKEANTLNEILTYDNNGNIKSLQRNQNLRGLSGLTVTSSAQTIDNLTYTYAAGNYLTKVEDGVSGSIGQAGFHNQANNTTEYTYNGGGQVAKDDNKGISSSVFNELGKPVEVNFSTGKKVTYVYDANGTKLNMKVFDGATLLSNTDYVGSYVYENNNLSFFGSPEGRVVKNGGTLEYQYSITDHQGNTRVVFTSATPAPQSTTISFESSTNAEVNNYPTGGSRSGWELFDHTDTGGSATYSQLLNGGNNSQIGVAKSYTIYPGDKIKIEAFAKYYNAQGTNSNLAGFAAALTGAFGVSAASTGEAALRYQALNSYGGIVAAGGGVGSASFPKLFVNILIFDRNYKLLDIAFEQIDGGVQTGVTPKASHDYMSREYVAKEAGFAFVYISNENSTYVEGYFDDVIFTFTPSNIVQYNEYYPFGLQTANSWTRTGNKNDFLYNSGAEMNRTSGIYEMLYRNYDAALGRMLQIDPMTEKYAGLSPFNYSFNDPVFWNDPLGADPDPNSEYYPRPPLIDEPGGVESGMIFINGRLMNPRSSSGQRQWSGSEVEYSQYLYALGGFGGANGIVLGATPLSNYPHDENGYYVKRFTGEVSDTWLGNDNRQYYYQYFEKSYLLDNPLQNPTQDGYRRRMSQTEISIFDKMSFRNQNVYLINGQRASFLASTLYPEASLNSGKGDAFRHAYFSALNLMSLGEDLTIRLGNAHEQHWAETELGRQMDLHNNAFGRQLAKTLGPKYITEANRVNAIRDGIIIGIKQGELLETVNHVNLPTNWDQKK